MEHGESINNPRPMTTPHWQGETEALHEVTMSKKPTCPQCHGFGVLLTFHGLSLGECEMCDGVGEIPPCVEKWHAYGSRLKSERIYRRLTLRDAAKKLGMDPSNLSKMERGIIPPRPLWNGKEIGA